MESGYLIVQGNNNEVKMAHLSYTDTITKVSKVEKVLCAPKDWACFTGATNSSLHKKAETVLECVYEFVDKALRACRISHFDYEMIRDLADEKRWKLRGAA